MLCVHDQEFPELGLYLLASTSDEMSNEVPSVTPKKSDSTEVCTRAGVLIRDEAATTCLPCSPSHAASAAKSALPSQRARQLTSEAR
ncbi:uncharacterized protein LJ206_011119 isoform 2-T2 [Theristicus caerulescens]